MKRIFIMFLLAALGFPQFIRGADHGGESLKYSPAEALERLKNGNARYIKGERKSPRADASRRAETATAQHPVATVIACSDSRCSVELLFDQGLGDVFVVRTAGNVCSVNEIGSTEYAVIHLNTPVCVVLGHTGCGAVTASVTNAKLEGSLPALLSNIQPAVSKAKAERPDLQGAALISLAVECNVRLGLENLLMKSEETRNLVANGKLLLIGAVYDVATGEVKWLGPHPNQNQLIGKTNTSVEKPAEAAAKSH